MYRPDIKTIYIDFDNTLVDTIKTIVSLYNEDFEYYKKFHHVNWWEIDSYDFKTLVELKLKKSIEQCKMTRQWNHDMKMMHAFINIIMVLMFIVCIIIRFY